VASKRLERRKKKKLTGGEASGEFSCSWGGQEQKFLKNGVGEEWTGRVNSSGSDSEPEEYDILGHDWDGVVCDEIGDEWN